MRSKMGLEVLQSGIGFGAIFEGALMRLFSRVPSHVNHQHVLSFEGFFLPGAILPLADKGLFTITNMVVVQML